MHWLGRERTQLEGMEQHVKVQSGLVGTTCAEGVAGDHAGELAQESNLLCQAFPSAIDSAF